MGKKFIAPVIVTVLFVIYFIFYFVCLLATLESIVAKVLFGVIPLLMSLLIVYVCIQRINEIKNGEEDDISKY